ncbi:hypothetical protein P8C59_004127 [Phyllachora maydis]|uniref:Polyamine transport protein n=2 Tax=Phyllachora maydis TaxID=1825666 RepID=A0AAD9I3E9_9PEZI|nr:hypothetical protein P8C59_004127 [Phyllachora maydis]
MEDQDAGRASPRSQAEDERSLMPFSMSAKLDYRRTRQWICDLLKYPDSYTSQLTQRPERARGGQATDDTAGPRDSVLSRVLTRQSTAMSKASTATNTIDNKFRLAVSNLEKLLHEAVDLAEEVADRDDDHRCPEQGGGTIQERSQSPPSIHESLPSMEEQCQLDEQEAGPRHAVLGMHSGNVKQPVPERLSSLPKARAHAGHGLLVISQLDDTPRPPPVSSPRPEDLPNRRAVREFIRVFDQPPIQPRGSSLNLRSEAQKETIGSMDRHSHRTPAESSPKKPARIKIAGKAVARGSADSWSFDGVPGDEVIDWRTQYNLPLIQTVDGNRSSSDQRVPYPTSAASAARDEAPEGGPAERAERARENRRINLRGRAHVSLRGYQGFSLARSHPRQPVARDWSSMRKRFVASVACISTALIGVLIGIYAGLVPSIQYWIADMDHYAILGNVGFYVGLAVPTFFFWPLPLLHGRKPYILSSLVVAMPLLFPQAIAVGTQRSPYVSAWRIALLVSRALMGFSLGFASMNFHSILTDLFGASLMSSKPHQEVVDKFDVRRHGGGMGVWLGIWTWCFTGSIAVGFMIGACIISTLNPSWGFYISIILIAVVLVLNVVCPEVRRSAFRRSVAEVRKGNVISRRVARGEIMMHRVKDGPTWWGPEVYHGMLLSLEMMRQPGFAIMALYTGWIYSQVVLIIVLLGSLTSRAYLLRSPLVGLCVALVAVGALIAVPFQKANIFSRGRQKELTNADTFKERRITWTSHLLRRAVFCIGLPLAGMAYTLVSSGPKIPVEVPTLFAAIVGNLSGLAISECNGLIMETFDTSDLQPGMTGRPRSASAKPSKRTNYSSFPRVTAGFACCHTMGFLLAAVATGVGGIAQRNLGQRAATGVVASILFVLTVLLLAVLIRFKEVRIIPSSKTVEMDKWTEVRIENIRRRSTMAAQAGGAHHGPSGPGARGGNATGAALPHTMTDEEIWRPVIMGNPSNKTRRVNVLELGSMTRWTEIRRKNKLIDQSTSAHLNRAALEDAAAHFNRHAMEDAAAAVELVTGIGARTTDLVRKVSNRGRNRSPGPPPAAGHPPQQQQGRHFYSGSPGGGAKTTTSKTPGTRAIPPLELDLEDVDHPLAADAGASHSDHDDESYGLPAHAQTRGAGHDFSERECVMGQTVVEEEEEEEEVGVETEESDDDELHPGHEHAPTTAAWKGKGKGKGKAVLDDEEWMERDPGSHVTAKVRNADEF